MKTRARAGVSPTRDESYGGDRSALIDLAPEIRGPVLDIGCAEGALGALLKSRQPSLVVWGIEAFPAAAAVAVERLDRVMIGSADRELAKLAAEGRFQPRTLIFADVLEHLEDPWAVVEQAVGLAAPGAVILVSLPNVAHWTSIAALLRGTWPRRERGIHDDTHLRWFGRRDLAGLLPEGVEVTAVRRRYRLVDDPTRAVNRLSRFIGPLWPNGFTYQHYVVARITGPDPSEVHRGNSSDA